jgi:hypothetical protein
MVHFAKSIAKATAQLACVDMRKMELKIQHKPSIKPRSFKAL